MLIFEIKQVFACKQTYLNKIFFNRMDKIPDKILEHLKAAIPDAMNYSRFLVFLATDSNPKYIQVMEQALKEGINCFNQTFRKKHFIINH